MAVEIERKFLVKNQIWKKGAESLVYIQGYLSNEKGKNVRVRVSGNQAFITIKGGAQYISRAEFEYSIPVEDALYMLDHLCETPLIEKTRYFVKHEGFLWEIDEFKGENEGLIIAEVELQSEEDEVPLPDWVAQEVTGIERYYNANLIRNPYKLWHKG
ncbi:MAG: CYTH domain-containing protein [Bernardetiaceae bacterium]|jgi:CYTH domain-containing protein|nr:CYTH domain-containing protein [Bernardetiaceae bacterium]